MQDCFFIYYPDEGGCSDLKMGLGPGIEEQILTFYQDDYPHSLTPFLPFTVYRF